jgi:superfamily II DNA or RNA helicase
MQTRSARVLTRRKLRDVLSHLTYADVKKLLGPSCDKLLREGGLFEIDLDSQVTLDDWRLTLDLGKSTVTLRLSEERSGRIETSCTTCTAFCEHVGAAFSLVLEEKLALGLSAPPHDDVPLETLTEEQLVERALADRGERSRKEKMSLSPLNGKGLWSDYGVTSSVSGKTYRVALRGWERGESYCSCPDFRTNTLGTCKHLIFALGAVKRRFPRSEREKSYRRTRISLHVRYGDTAELRLALPEKLEVRARAVAAPLADAAVTDMALLLSRIQQLERLGHPVHIYPDAEEMVNGLLLKKRLDTLVGKIRRDPAAHPLRKSLLHVELLPYQMDGIAFAAGAGRAILADDMGLGKTMQGIGAAELLAREVGISRVLVVCPASVKSQWAVEIQRASGRTARLVAGGARERAEMYQGNAFYTVCNYEQVLRDLPSVERARWDLIILDEGQRIKNWQAKTSRVIKSLASPFALVLSGTPLENRLDELYSVVQFINARQLGPAFRFFHRHRVVDEKGRVLGYKNLDQLRRDLGPILLRRTRAMVLRQLPPRSTEILRITPTAQQAEIHDGHKRTVSAILAKRYISEMDLLRLQKALLMCRMAADSTFLVDKEPPGHSTKLAELDSLLEKLCAEQGRKIILFSEWTTMLDLIEPLVEKHDIGFVRLDGSVPQAKRQALVNRFQRDPGCTLFMTTNAGATGLNLQAADTVVNVDLPWNPAVLEQRIARAHRMGQKRPVHVYILVTEGTIEEGMLSTLSAKQTLALAALDPDSTVKEVSLTGSIDELKRRLEVLIGEKPAAPVDEITAARVHAEAKARRETVARAGGEMLGAAFRFIGELLGEAGGAASAQGSPPGASAGSQMHDRMKGLLSECMERTEDGGWRMSVKFADAAALDSLADVLARLATRS